MRALDGSDSDDFSNDESEDGPYNVDLNSVAVVLGDNCAQFQEVKHKDIQHPLNDEDITVSKANVVIPDSIAYVKAPASDLKTRPHGRCCSR